MLAWPSAIFHPSIIGAIRHVVHRLAKVDTNVFTILPTKIPLLPNKMYHVNKTCDRKTVRILSQIYPCLHFENEGWLPRCLPKKNWKPTCKGLQPLIFRGETPKASWSELWEIPTKTNEYKLDLLLDLSPTQYLLNGLSEKTVIYRQFILNL